MIKCIVWDLDQTLWRGTLGEDEQVLLPEENRALLEHLDASGILQSIASRNDPDTAMEQLRKLGIDHYFLYPQLGFHSKALSIQTIAQKLNIGLDTIAFLDDNEFELREIGYFLPQVARYHAWSHRNSLMEAVGQEGTGTAESRNRRVFMQAQEKRDQEELKFSGTREEFLRDCAMRLTIREAREDDLARVCELVERSSQYKTFSQTVDPDFCRRYRASTQSKLWVAELEDRFGQYGIIGVCFLRSGDGNVWIDQFCISCRVGGRGIGVVFLQTVLDQCQGMGNPCFKAVCCFTPTKRNRPVVILLRTLGFRKSQSQDGQGGLEVALPVAHVACDWITIIVDKG